MRKKKDIPKFNRIDITVILGLFIITISCSILFPPYFFHFGGTDASNYVNLSAKYAFDFESSKMFYPVKDLNKSTLDILDKTFTDMRGERKGWKKTVGLMTPYVFVSKEHTIYYPHFHLYPMLMSFTRSIGFSQLAEYFNYIMLFITCVMFYLIARTFQLDRAWSVLSSLSLFLIPSYIVGARYPLSEATTLAFHIMLVFCSLVPNKKYQKYAFIFLILLAWTRSEFIVVTLCLVIFNAVNSKNIKTSSILCINLVVEYFYYLNVNAGHIESATVNRFLFFGLISPLFYLAILLLSRTRIVKRIIFITKKTYDQLTDQSKIIYILYATFWISIVTIDIIKQNLSPGTNFLFIKSAKYSTINLLFESTGLFFVFGVIFFGKNIKRILRNIEKELFVIIIPQAYVLINMTATPNNNWYWLRRFHVLIFPLLILGTIFMLLETKRFFQKKNLGRFLPNLLIITIIIMIFGQNFKGYQSMPKNYLKESYLKLFHSQAETFPNNAIIIHSEDNYSKTAQYPLRTFHGLWTYVVWDVEFLSKSLQIMERWNKPIYIDKKLLGKIDVTCSHESILLYVIYSKNNHGIIEFCQLKTNRNSN